MTIHICRDFQGLEESGPPTAQYLMSIFLHKVMNFSIVGHTNYPLTSSTHMRFSGSSASINLDPTFEKHVLFPSGTYVPTLSDITGNRILALRSETNPRLNSGMFRIVGTGSFSGSTTVEIDYRSSENPPPESGSLQWAVFNSEATAPDNTSDNGLTPLYEGNGGANSSRIIFQSPHSSSWQVRLSRETGDTTAFGPQHTIAPGTGGDSSGDFPVSGEHLHSGLWFNHSNSNKYIAGTTGFDGGNTTESRRWFIWGEQDDTPGSFIMWSRTPTITSTRTHHWGAFGFCEDEIQPLPPKTTQRMFSFGYESSDNGGVQSAHWWGATANSGNRTLVGFGLNNQPLLGGIGGLTFVRASAGTGTTIDTNHPIYLDVATDNQWLGATELVSNEIFVGVAQAAQALDAVFKFEPRRLGTFPLARMGRGNFGDFQQSSGSNDTWIHMIGGVYLPWSGSTIP